MHSFSLLKENNVFEFIAYKTLYNKKVVHKMCLLNLHFWNFFPVKWTAVSHKIIYLYFQNK